MQSGTLNEEQIARLNCELKFLEQKDFYSKLKNKIISGFKNQEKHNNWRSFENNLLDRNMYRREKPLKRTEGLT